MTAATAIRTTLQESVRYFMGACDQHVNEFNARQAALYTGLQLEEMAEKLRVILKGSVQFEFWEHELVHLIRSVEVMGDRFKAGHFTGNILRLNADERADLLDADIDLAWVSLGGAYSVSCNVEGAVVEVARANLDKVPGGVCTRDENGKVQKPDGWRPPDLSPFIAPIPRY